MKINFKNLIYKGIQNPHGVLNFIVNLPKLIKLYYRLFKDPRTPLHLKALLVLAFLYVLSPIDLLPDFLFPIVGHVDDFIILIAALRYFIRKSPPEIVAEHVQKINDKAI